MACISIQNLYFGYDKNLFSNISFDIDKKSFICIYTPSSMGKTTLLKLISSKNNKNIMIDSNIKKITYLSIDTTFYAKTVIEELLLVSNDIKRIKQLLLDFNMLKFLKVSPVNLSYIEIQKLLLIKSILDGTDLLLIDNIFSFFDKHSKIEYMSYLKKYQFEKNMTIICTINSLDDALFCDRIIIINNEIIFNDSIDKLFPDNIDIKKTKLNISLQDDLIQKLKLYEIIENFNYTIEDLVGKICE